MIKGSNNQGLINLTKVNFIFRLIKDSNYLVKLKDSSLNKFNDVELINKVQECVDHTLTLFDVKIMWLMIYPPKSYLSFHNDHGKMRHAISFYKNEQFFNYAIPHVSAKVNTIDVLNKKFFDSLNDINHFNEFFLNYDETCEIVSLDTNMVYCFGDTIHTFYNASDKLRINLIFEIYE